MTLRDQLELIAATTLGVKTKGLQVWNPAALLRSDTLRDYLDCEATITWETVEHDTWIRRAVITVEAEPPFPLFVCD